MAEVLVLVEHAEGALKKVTAELITAARVLGEPAAIVVGTSGTAAPLIDGLKEAGAAKIYVAESDDVDKYLITPAVEVLAALAESNAPAAVLLAANADGKEIAGRLAARIGSGLLVDVVEVKEGAKATHSIFGGAFTVEAQANGDTPVITVRAGAIDAEPAAGAGEQVTVEVPAPAENATKITAREPAVAGDRPELTEATIVVSGGRGVGSAENFSVVEALADSLGAAVGGARPPRGRLRLLPGPVPGRPDRQDGIAPALHRAGHLRRDPAPRRHADLEDHRRGQQGRRGAHLRNRRLRRGGRPVQGRSPAHRCDQGP
jgi:electron transfer flavoprotein alpha subunit